MAQVPHWSSDEEVGAYLERVLRKEAGDRSGLIYGMGHAVYTLSDPRAVLLKEQAQKLAREKGEEWLQKLDLFERVERLAPEIFYRVKGQEKWICANVDFYSGFLYSMLGIVPDLYTPLFAVSRIAGWCAHRMEEGMTGGRIIRPAYDRLRKPSRMYRWRKGNREEDTVKIAYAWWVFLGSLLIAIPLRICQIAFLVDHRGFFLDHGVTAIILTLFVLCSAATIITMCHLDKHSPKRYTPVKNIRPARWQSSQR